MVSILSKGRELYQSTKREISEQALSQALNILGHTSEENYRRLSGAFHRIANTEQQKMIADWIGWWVSPGNPGAQFLHRLIRNTHPNVRKNFLAKILVNLFFRNPYAYKRFKEENGFMPPAILLISPTMRCNYHCLGCYASEYSRKDELPPEVLDRVITEAKAVGTRFFIFVGGEPLIYRPIFDLIKKHHDVAFHVYTNASLIDEAVADRIVALGNVAPQISLEGFREETDQRRGPGSFDRAVRAMDLLRERGVIFAFSATVYRDNVDVVTSDEWIDFMIEKGAMYGWYFLYMPVGGDTDLSLMPTPAERDKVRRATQRFRKTKPMIFADFWGDSPLTGGCIAGGRLYLHLNHRGDLEPCIFCHFAVPGYNVKEKPYAEALKSPLLMAWRRMQPFNYNALRPCPIIDHPRVLRTLVHRYGAQPTHPGAEHVITTLEKDLDRYSQGMAQLYSPALWEDEYPWAEKWLEVMDFPVERVQARKAGYEAGKETTKTNSPILV